MATAKKAAPKKAAPKKAAAKKATQQPRRTPGTETVHEEPQPNRPSIGQIIAESIQRIEKERREEEEAKESKKELCRDCKVEAILEILSGSNATDVRYILEEASVQIRPVQEDAIREHQRVLHDLQTNHL